jgi:hypothetical protein
MKHSLLLYLFILALLFNIFTYAYYSKQVDFQKTQIEKLTKKLNSKEKDFNSKLQEANYFTFENNEKAQFYFTSNPDQKSDLATLIPAINQALLKWNENPNGNPYTGQKKLGVNKFIINKIKVINHRWIIADFSDGENWGEVLLKYFVKENNTFTFEINQSLMFPKK